MVIIGRVVNRVVMLKFILFVWCNCGSSGLMEVSSGCILRLISISISSIVNVF